MSSSAEVNEGALINLSILEAINTAYKHNRDILIEEQKVAVAQAAVIEAQSEFLPKLDAVAGYTRNGNVLSLSSAGAKKDLGIFTGYKNDNTLGLQLTQILYNGRENAANLRQKRLQLNIEEQSLRAAKLDTEFDARRLYFGLLLARETQRIAEGLLSQAKSHYEEVQKKFAQGSASKFDLLQSKVQVSKVFPELIRAKSSVSLIESELKKLLGLKQQAKISLKDGFAYSPVKTDESDFLKTAYIEKPEMILVSLGVDVSKWSIERAKSYNRPQVYGKADYTYRSNDPMDMINKRHNNWDAGISVTVPIFDGFSSKAKVDQARSRYAGAVIEKENVAEAVAVEIKKACVDLDTAQSVIDSQKDNIEEAREALRIAEARYRNGEGTNLDVMDSQVSLSQVEKNLSEAIYDYLLALAYLDRTMGRSLINGQNGKKQG
jgi:outer membrane protein TolC